MSNFNYKESVARSLAEIIALKMNKRAYSREDLDTLTLRYNNICENAEDEETKTITDCLLIDMLPNFAKTILK